MAYVVLLVFFFNDTATTEIYTYRHTLSLHDALPIFRNAHVERRHKAAYLERLSGGRLFRRNCRAECWPHPYRRRSNLLCTVADMSWPGHVRRAWLPGAGDDAVPDDLRHGGDHQDDAPHRPGGVAGQI